MAKFCANCGSSIEGAGKYCPSCGAKVMEDMDQGAPPPEGTTEKPQPMMSQNATGQSFGQQPYDVQLGQGRPNAAYGMGMMGAQTFDGEHYVPDEGIEQMFFRCDNRLNRKRYFMRGLALSFGVIVVITVLGTVLGLAGVSGSVIGSMGLTMAFPSFALGFMLAIRRLHDLDRPAWWAIGIAIPFVNLLLSLYLLLAKGTEGPNQYGPDPLEGQP